MLNIEQKLDRINNAKHSSEVWLNTKQAAQALGVSTRTLQTYRDQGLIPFSQFKREVRFKSDDLQDFLMAHYVKSRYQEGGDYES